MFGLRKNYVIISLTKNELINFDFEVRGSGLGVLSKKLKKCDFSGIFLSMMQYLKLNRLEIYKFMAFVNCAFKT